MSHTRPSLRSFLQRVAHERPDLLRETTFRAALLRLAHAKPEFRRHLLPLLRRVAAGQCDQVRGNKRDDLIEPVWDMFVLTYSSIGLKLKSPSELLRYPMWEVCNAGGRPVTFNVFKETPFGFKSGLAGSDGSSEGKSAIVGRIRRKYHERGHYGEVSHKVEATALAAGAPVVCAAYVPQILGKPVEKEKDGLHYTRNIQGLGAKTKIMLGRPNGIPVTSFQDAVCPVTPPQDLPKLAQDDGDDLFDALAHHACEMLD